MINFAKIFFSLQLLIINVILFTTINSFQKDEEQNILKFAVSNQVLFGINVSDAKLALNILLGKYIEEEGIEYKTDVEVFEDLDEMVEKHHKSPFDIIFVLSSEYLYLRQRIELEPFFSSSRKDTLYTNYNLLVNVNSRIKTINDLQDSRIDFFSNPVLERSLTYRALDKLCLDKYDKAADKVFSSMQRIENPHNSLLKVFFGNVDACFIEKFQYDVMSELNPQLKKQIKVIYTTEEFVTGLACVTPYIEDEQLFREKALVMHKTTYGKQFLDIFKISTVFKITKEDLKTVEILFNESELLSKKTEE